MNTIPYDKALPSTESFFKDFNERWKGVAIPHTEPKLFTGNEINTMNKSALWRNSIHIIKSDKKYTLECHNEINGNMDKIYYAKPYHG